MRRQDFGKWRSPLCAFALCRVSCVVCFHLFPLLSLLVKVSGAALHAVLSRHLSCSFDEINVDSGQVVVAPSDEDPRRRNPNKPRLITRQSVLLSASIPQPRHFIKLCAQERWTAEEPEWIHVVNAGNAVARTPNQINHMFRAVEATKKLGCLRAYIKREVAERRLSRCIVFLNPDRPLAEIAKILERDFAVVADNKAAKQTTDGEVGEGNHDLVDDDESEVESEDEERRHVGVLHHEAGLIGRASTMAHFRSGHSTVLLATDLASRGLDVPETSHVVMFDMPGTAETYLHRAGRTGRMGRKGSVLTLGAATEQFVVERHANSLGIAIDVV
mmetsp:Transcript_44877/g.76298  ORF Transcript_44877/g.76298 Transcript_44877/m.76298 type:complete len:331 (-) Transcript_44877:133-1125(-)